MRCVKMPLIFHSINWNNKMNLFLKKIYFSLTAREESIFNEHVNTMVNVELTSIADDCNYRVFDNVKLVGIDGFFIKVILSNGNTEFFGKSSVRRISAVIIKRLRTAA